MEAPTNDRARAVWARTRLKVWPEPYALVSLPPDLLGEAAALLARTAGTFAALVLERDEVSLTLPQSLWQGAGLRTKAAREDGPYRAITLDADVDLDVCGYLAPAAVGLAEAGVSIVPQCAYRKDHLLVKEAGLEAAVRLLEELIARSRG
jgi:hypothetical protein